MSRSTRGPPQQSPSAAPSFFFEKTLNRKFTTVELVRQPREKKLPVILSIEESASDTGSSQIQVPGSVRVSSADQQLANLETPLRWSSRNVNKVRPDPSRRLPCLSELRKYRVSMILAHQYISQLDPQVRDAVLGNTGTIITFRLGAEDAQMLAKEFSPELSALDLTTLPNYHIYLKLMVQGNVTRPFSAKTLKPLQRRRHAKQLCV